MDLLYRKDKISAGQDKLSQIIGSISVQNPVEAQKVTAKPMSASTRRLQEIIDQIRDIDQKRYGYFRYVLLASLLLIAGSWYAIQGGAVIDTLILALSFIIYLWIAHRLMRSLRAKNGLDHGDRFLPMQVTEEMDHKSTVDRALSVIELGQRRLLLVTLCHAIFFPVLLVLIYAIWVEVSLLTPHYTWAWITSIILSTICWYIYDNSIVNGNDELIDALKRLVW